MQLDKIRSSEDILKIGPTTFDSWNKRGYEGLVPNFSGGPKPKLGDVERNDLKRMIAEKDAWTLREVRELVKCQRRFKSAQCQRYNSAQPYKYLCSSINADA